MVVENSSLVVWLFFFVFHLSLHLFSLLHGGVAGPKGLMGDTCWGEEPVSGPRCCSFFETKTMLATGSGSMTKFGISAVRWRVFLNSSSQQLLCSWCDCYWVTDLSLVVLWLKFSCSCIVSMRCQNCQFWFESQRSNSTNVLWLTDLFPQLVGQC